MKTKLMKRGLCIALVAVMILGLAVINAGACSCPTYYWELENSTYDYYVLDENYHDVCKSDIANCKLCGDIFTYCTHWYSEPHNCELMFSHYQLVYTGGDPMWEAVFKYQCVDCDYHYLAGF